MNFEKAKPALTPQQREDFQTTVCVSGSLDLGIAQSTLRALFHGIDNVNDPIRYQQ